MPLENEGTVDGIEDLNPAWPTGTDPKSEGDDHIRIVKKAVLGSFPNSTGAWSTSEKISGVGLDAGNSKVTQVAAGVDSLDAVNKTQLDNVAALVPPVLNLLGGCVGSNGAPLGANINWSSYRASLGTYVVNFTIAGGGFYDQGFTATPIDPDNRTCTIAITNSTSITVYTRNSLNGDLVDENFSFVRLGA